MDRRNPFGIHPDDEYFEERIAAAFSDSGTLHLNLTEGMEMLRRWQEENPPYWYVTVIDGYICADGEAEEIEKTSTRFTQARDLKEAALKLHQDEKFIKGPFDTLELARKG